MHKYEMYLDRRDLKRAFKRKPPEEVGPYDFTFPAHMIQQATLIMFSDGRRHFLVKNVRGQIGEITAEQAALIRRV